MYVPTSHGLFKLQIRTRCQKVGKLSSLLSWQMSMALKTLEVCAGYQVLLACYINCLEYTSHSVPVLLKVLLCNCSNSVVSIDRIIFKKSIVHCVKFYSSQSPVTKRSVIRAIQFSKQNLLKILFYKKNLTGSPGVNRHCGEGGLGEGYSLPTFCQKCKQFTHESPATPLLDPPLSSTLCGAW